MALPKQEVSKQELALRYLKRPNGASVEFLADRLELPNTKAARGIVDRLREKGVKIKNTASHTFKVRTRRNPRSSAQAS